MIAAENDELLLSSLRGPPGERTGRAPGQRAVGGHDAPPPPSSLGQASWPHRSVRRVTCLALEVPAPGG